MELAPPSYLDATHRNHWALVAPYVQFDDLAQACLVCKDWHDAFAPELWGNPMQSASLRFEDPWFALRRFENILLYVARLRIREMTHTLEVPLDLESLHLEIGSWWLYNLLSSLPRLQSLSVRGVNYFDQSALSTLFKEVKVKIPKPESARFMQNLRLLDASSCINISELSAWNISQMFPNLVYLDLSGVPGSTIIPSACITGGLPLRSISVLQHLKVLKLRGCRLNDSMVRVLAATIKKRLRSLDLRDNPLTNSSVLALLKYCLVRANDINGSTWEQYIHRNSSFDDPPGYERPESQSRHDVQSLDERLHATLTSGLIGRIALEDDGQPGITQLRLSLSTINLQALFTVMECPNLQYLDVQTGGILFDSTDDRVPSRSNVEYLRIRHSLVTKASATNKPAQTFQNITYKTMNLPTVIELRKQFAEIDQTDWVNLIPNLRKLRTLVLTGIPEYTSDIQLADRLIALLRSCGVAGSLAAAQAHFEFSSGTNKKITKSRSEERRQKALSPLTKIEFELVPGQREPQLGTPKGWNLPEYTRAVTGDRDSKAIWDIANDDYSFFDHPGNDGEPDARLEISSPRSIKSERRDSNLDDGRIKDVAAAIVAFRKDSRTRYTTAVSMGKQYDILHDYLDATVSLVRNKT